MPQPISSFHINTEPTWRGGEQQMLYLLEGLARRGHPPLACVQKGAPLAERARDAGIETVELRMRGEVDPIAVLRLARLMRSHRPALVHFHTSHAHSLGAMAAALLGRKRPRTLLSRRVDFSIYRHSFLGLNHIKYAKVDHIVAISEAIRRVLEDDGIPTERLETVPSGIDPSRFEVEPVDLAAEAGFPPDTTVIVNVAHFADHKGQRHLVNAAPSILAAAPQSAIFLVGEGELRPELIARARELGVEERVRFPGFRRDVPAILRGSDIYVMPSHQEGLGTSVLDALWCRLPVVATAAGGIPEIVHDGENGFLVAPHDEAALAEAILALVRDPERRATLGAAGPAVVESRYTVDKMVEGNLAVYRRLLSSTDADPS